jgi:general stress protein 26
MNAKDKINDVLKNHNMAHVATIDSEGMPCVRGVDYAAEDGADCFYFITHKHSRKVQQIRSNNNVAFVIDHDCLSWEELQEVVYFKGTGTATLIEDPEGMQWVFGLVIQKFPFLKRWDLLLETLPGESTDFIGVRIDFKEILLTDNTVRFGQTETVNY